MLAIMTQVYNNISKILGPNLNDHRDSNSNRWIGKPSYGTKSASIECQVMILILDVLDTRVYRYSTKDFPMLSGLDEIDFQSHRFLLSFCS